MDIKSILADNILKTYINCNKVLQYTDESTENYIERFVGLLNKIQNVL